MSGIVHWDRLVHKGVRSKDMEDMGNVIAIDDLIITTMQGRHEFKIPRTCVDDFNDKDKKIASLIPKRWTIEYLLVAGMQDVLPCRIQ